MKNNIFSFFKIEFVINYRIFRRKDPKCFFFKGRKMSKWKTDQLHGHGSSEFGGDEQENRHREARSAIHDFVGAEQILISENISFLFLKDSKFTIAT